MKTKTELFSAHLKDCAGCKSGALCPAGKAIIDQADANTDEVAAHAHAGALDIVNGVLPTNLQWMPPGRHTVKPVGFEAPFEINVTPAIAAVADAQLQQMRQAHAAGQAVEPYIDINHEDKVRAFLPTKISWGGEDPKSGGIRVEGKWTGGGASAALNGEQCVISPSWTLHKVTKAFLGIKRNLGGLVPESAFTSIQAFAKADSSNETTQPKNKMSKEELAAALAEGLKPVLTRIDMLEANAKASETATATRLKALEDGTNATTQANAKKTVEELGVKAGRIASQDKETIAFWEGAIAVNAKAADALVKMPVNPAFVQVVQNGAAGGAGGTATGEHEFVAKAKAFATANKIEDAIEAQAKFAATKEGVELYESYRATMGKAE